MTLYVTTYSDAQADEWDRLVETSTSGTFLHTRKFLGYHRDRFEDASVCIWDSASLVGVLPAARDPGNSARVTSHPGLTYGGLLHCGKLRGQDMLDAINCIINHYAEHGYKELRYKAIPVIYHRAPSQDDIYAIFRVAGRRYRCDLSVAIDLGFRLQVSNRRKRAIKKAQQANVIVSEDSAFDRFLWNVLEYNLAEKHSARPAHSLKEIRYLHGLFPRNIQFLSAIQEGKVIAGAVLFITPTAVHAQYICSNDNGYAVNALDMVLERGVHIASALGARYFNFGICNEDNGNVLNDGLFRFKMEFGGAGIVHEFYDIAIC